MSDFVNFFFHNFKLRHFRTPTGTNYLKILHYSSFFYEIECKGRRSKMQPLWISKGPCISEEKGKLIKGEGGGVGACAPGF